MAAPISPSATDLGTAVQSPIVGFLAIITGLFLVFSGYKMFKVSLFIAGALFFSNLANIVLSRFVTGLSDNTVLIIIIIAGLIGGILAFNLYSLGLSLVGALGGISVALFLLSTKSDGLIANDSTRLVLIVIAAIIGVIAVHMFEKPVLFAATSIIGATLVGFGVDVFAKTGFGIAVALFLYGQLAVGSIPFLFEGKTAAIMIGVVILAVIGFFFQSRNDKS